MRRYLTAVAAVGLVLTAAGRARAQDEPKAIIEKAIKAYGGADKLAKLKTVKAGSKGTIIIMGMELNYHETTYVDLPNNHFRSELTLMVNGMEIPIVTVYDGKDAWISANGQAVDLPADKKAQTAAELKSALYGSKVGQLAPLLTDKAYTLSPMGEIPVNGKPAVGVKISHTGERDLEVYFDKGTGLIAKMAKMAKDEMGNDINEERFPSEYKDQDGLKRPSKIKVLRNGAKFLEGDVVEVKILDTVDANLFTKP